MSKSDSLIESKSLRESVIDRTDVLEKVKALTMLPDDLHVSIEQSAEYYEVGKEAINSLIKDNREELESDGLRLLRGEELMSFKDMGVIGKKSSSFTIIPRQAILRIGMLLRDSQVARSVRDYLLNVEDIARKEAPRVIEKAISQPSWRKIQSNIKAKRDLFMLVGVSKESAIAHALTHEELASSVDLAAFKREVRTDDTEKTYTPTDIGKLMTEKLSLPNTISAIKVNSLLEQAGLQVKNIKGEWELADKGKPYAKLIPMAIHGKLANLTEKGITLEKFAIRWRESVLGIITVA